MRCDATLGGLGGLTCTQTGPHAGHTFEATWAPEVERDEEVCS